MKKADKPSIVININVYGDNNKVSTNETRSHVPAAVIVIVLIAVAVLAVSFCCPELLPDFVRWGKLRYPIMFFPVLRENHTPIMLASIWARALGIYIRLI